MMMNDENNDDANGADKEPLSNFPPIPILQKKQRTKTWELFFF